MHYCIMLFKLLLINITKFKKRKYIKIFEWKLRSLYKL